MNLSAPVMKTLLMAASLGMVVPMLAQSSAPARPRSTAKKDKENDIVLPGVVIPRGAGWMSLSIENGGFRLGFYDADKKAVLHPPPEPPFAGIHP